MSTTGVLARPVLPLADRPPLDALPHAAEFDGGDVIPSQLSRATVGDRMRADLLPDTLASLAELAALPGARTPTVRALLARADQFVRVIAAPGWSPVGLETNEMSRLCELLDTLRALLAVCAYSTAAAVVRAATFWRHALSAVLRSGSALAELLARALPTPHPRLSSGRRLSSSSLSRTDPPALFRDVARLAMRENVQTVIKT